MTQEPVGVTWEPSTGHYFVSEDGGKRVYNVNPGADGKLGTSGDTWTYWSTLANGNNNGDPEGIAYDTAQNHLFVADGVNAEIYEYTTAGTLLGHFDVGAYGVGDPETVEYNPVGDTLFVLSNRQSGPIIVETTKSGALLQTIDVSAAADFKPAGLAYAPASNGTGVKRFYFADRGIDNNNDPRIIDGKIFEFTAPSAGPPVNNAPFVNAGPDQTISQPANANLDGTVSDDGLPNPPGAVTTTWSKVSGPGTVTFGNPNAVDTTASFSVAGTYVLRLLADDSALTSNDTVTITVNPSGTNQPPSVNAGPDQSITLRASAALDGTVTDDGQPGQLTTTWSKVSGPGTVTFGSVSAVDTTATFSATGAYVLRLSAFDGALTSSDEITVTVNAATLYFSVGTVQTLSGVAVSTHDIVAFDGSSFSLLLDGEDVGLDAASENIDALELLPNGHLLVSTTGSFSVPGLSGKDEDVIELTPGLLGATSTGSWSMRLDGSVVGLEASGRTSTPSSSWRMGTCSCRRGISSTSRASAARTRTFSTSLRERASGRCTSTGPTSGSRTRARTSMASRFRAATSTCPPPGTSPSRGVSGADEDVFVFTPTTLGANTTGTFSSTLFFDGAFWGSPGTISRRSSVLGALEAVSRIPQPGRSCRTRVSPYAATRVARRRSAAGRRWELDPANVRSRRRA